MCDGAMLPDSAFMSRAGAQVTRCGAAWQLSTHSMRHGALKAVIHAALKQPLSDRCSSHQSAEMSATLVQALEASVCCHSKDKSKWIRSLRCGTMQMYNSQ